MEITRAQMIDAVSKNIKYYETRMQRLIQANKSKSFEFRGVETRYGRATELWERLRRGNKPTTQEVVGYFGKGARFTEDN